MSDEVWFEEELVPSAETVDETVKLLVTGSADFDKGKAEKDIKNVARGIVRVHKPRWEKLDPQKYRLLTSGGGSRFYIVRLGFEFAIKKDDDDWEAQFIYGLCSAKLWPATKNHPSPTVSEVIPRDFYEGEQRKVAIKLAPQVEIVDIASGSLGEVSTDFYIGTVEPAIVGFLGEEERKPYWELRPKSNSLIGIRHLWMVIDVPIGCDKTCLAVRAEGNIQAHFGPIPVGPKVREWDKRPSIIIE